LCSLIHRILIVRGMVEQPGGPLVFRGISHVFAPPIREMPGLSGLNVTCMPRIASMAIVVDLAGGTAP